MKRPLGQTSRCLTGSSAETVDANVLEFAADTVHLAALGDFLQAQCAGHPQLILIELAVTEVVVNLIKHGEASYCRVTVTTCADTIDVKVEDDGIDFDITQLKPQAMGELREHGYGLAIIRRAVKQLLYSREDGLSCLLLRFSR